MTQRAFPIFTVSTQLATDSDLVSSLDGIDTNHLDSGTFGWVKEGSPNPSLLYRLDLSSVAAPDGVNVVAPLEGPGRWIQFPTGALQKPDSTLSSAISTSTTALGAADVYRMLTPGTTLTISTVDLTEGRNFTIRSIAASVGSPVTVVREDGGAIDTGVSALLTFAFDVITLQFTGGNLESK